MTPQWDATPPPPRRSRPLRWLVVAALAVVTVVVLTAIFSLAYTFFLGTPAS